MEIKVSIICNTYNQKEYIKDALNGFVSQITNFGFEVLIHDDASTDGTQDIIREYEKKYPDIIKPIYQTVNQYSQHIPIGKNYQLPRVQGKYIALCEGDDYWIDPYKLQKQFDAMEAHTEVDICAHSWETLNCLDNKKTVTIIRKDQSIIPVEDVILGGGGFVATNSLFYRKKIAEQEMAFRTMLSYDYTLQVQGALRGGMLYLPDVMSVYRYMAKGSWTRSIDRNVNKIVGLKRKWYSMLLQLNEDTYHKYETVINARILIGNITQYEGFLHNWRIYKRHKNGMKLLTRQQKTKIFLKLICAIGKKEYSCE